LVVGSLKDHRILLWSLDENKKWNYKFITKLNGGISTLGFSPNGRYLASFTT
jgi:WD40 repeat protein